MKTHWKKAFKSDYLSSSDIDLNDIIATISNVNLEECVTQGGKKFCNVAYFEEDSDKQDGHASIAVYLGKVHTRKIIWLLIVASSAINFYLLIMKTEFMYSVVILLMILTLAFLIVFENIFLKHERYRMLGDMIFLYPLLILSLEWLQ